MYIREINPLAEAEIELVAQRMRATLVEVEGPEVGVALCSMDWLRDRVRWHLDGASVTAKIFLAVRPDGDIVGHTIVRHEVDQAGNAFGLFSTTYVIPAARRGGMADALLRTGEQWMREQALGSAATWTSSTNSKLISLYAKRGYSQTAQYLYVPTETLMVKLERRL